MNGFMGNLSRRLLGAFHSFIILKEELLIIIWDILPEGKHIVKKRSLYFSITLSIFSVFDRRRNLVVRMFFFIHVFWFVWDSILSRRGSLFFFFPSVVKATVFTLWLFFKPVGWQIHENCSWCDGEVVGRQVRAEDALP